MSANPIITELIDTPDTVELIRDQIAAILHLELSNQKNLAKQAHLEDAADYDIAVYLEKLFSFDIEGQSEKFPAVNVQLVQSDEASGSSRVDASKHTAIFYLDCYGCGNVGNADTDKAAVIKAWKVGRLVRNIIGAGQYAYLGLRPGKDGKAGVCSRKIRRRSAGVPRGLPDGAYQVVICRLELEVSFYEFSPQASGVKYELYDFVCRDPEGKVYFHI